jgi:hypothetical protein
MPVIQLTIALDTDSGTTHVSGPIDNQVLAYGLLEVARDAIQDQKRRAEQTIIQAPPQGFVLP